MFHDVLYTELEALSQFNKRVEGQGGNMRFSPSVGFFLGILFVLYPPCLLGPFLLLQVQYVHLRKDLVGIKY